MPYSSLHTHTCSVWITVETNSNKDNKNIIKHLFNVYYVPSIVLSALYLLAYLIHYDCPLLQIRTLKTEKLSNLLQKPQHSMVG